MNDLIKGLECRLPDGGMKRMLQFLSAYSYDCYIPYCSIIDQKAQLLPHDKQIGKASQEHLEHLLHAGIWELIIHVYEAGTEPVPLLTYETFLQSACICYVYYYDCGELTIYCKDRKLLNSLHALAQELGASELIYVTDRKYIMRELAP